MVKTERAFRVKKSAVTSCWRANGALHLSGGSWFPDSLRTALGTC